MDTTTTAFIPPTEKPVAQSASISQPVQQTQIQPQGQNIKTITANDGTVLDAGVVNLSKAIRQQESGGNYNAVGDNGTSHGAYQWQPGNFASDAKQFGLDPNDFSPVNQDKVAYAQINAYKNAGYSPEQIASLWNSGKPDATGNVGVKTINGKPVNYDTPKYVQGVMNYFNQNKIQNPGVDPNQQTENQTQQEESPSVGGFAGNVVKSGANFVGNIADAVLHPIQTVQNIGGAGVGALQELGGQTNDNTVKFDALKGYFENRYGSVDNLLHTAYTDPVGLAGDISAVLGVGGGVAGALGKGAEVAGLGEGAIEAGGADMIAGAEGTSNVARSTAGSGLAGGLQKVSEGLGIASVYTNPLTPLVKGAGALLNQSKNLSDIIANPQNYTPEEMAHASAESISKDVQDAFEKQRADLSETGSAYNPLKNSAQFTEVAPDALARLIERNAGVTIDETGKVEAGGSIVSSKQVSALQDLYNTFNPKFASGELTANEFLQLRNFVNEKLAKFDNPLVKDSDLAKVGKGMYSDLNKLYRPNISGLEDLDTEFSTKIKKLDELEEGLVYKTGKNIGQIKDNFISKAGKALKTEDTDRLAQLEEISPGITKRLQIMKTLKDLGSPSFTTSIVEKGGIVGGLLTGNIKGTAMAIASIVLSQPEIAVPLLRAIGASLPLVKAVMANLAKYTTLSVTGNNAVQSLLPNTESPRDTAQSLEQTPSPVLETIPIPVQNDSSSPNPTINPADVQALAVEKNFNYAGAKKAGHSDQEIMDYLKNS